MLPPCDAITMGCKLHVTLGADAVVTVNPQSGGMRAPCRNTRMSPTFGPISVVLAADTMATVLASSAAMRQASIAVLATSLGGSLMCLCPLIDRDP